MDGQVQSGSAPATGAASPRAFVEVMRGQTEQMVEAVMGAVNAAPDGAWINGSEMQVRDLLEAYRQRVYEAALQQRVDAAEGAFSPGGPGDPPTLQEQGR